MLDLIEAMWLRADTVVAEPLYASVGFEVAGVIPNFAWDPDRQARHTTTLMFRQL